MDFNDYLNKDVSCSCGRAHRCDIDDVIIEPGAVEKLSDLLIKGGYKQICVLEDENTKKVLGDRVKAIVKEAGYSVSVVTLPGDHLLPDETGIGSVLTGVPADTDLILAVGGGTINDLGKFVSYKMNIPYFIICTAPSVDGFSSNVAAMVTKKAKVTYSVHMAKAIIADVSVLKDAPMDLIGAGVGDMLGKYICLIDWKLSNLLTGEYYCDYVSGLVKESLRKTVHAAEMLAKSRDEDSITELMNGLVLSGICMSYIGNSRPASGSEHHLGHFWEMSFLQYGEHGAYHGAKVGVGTVLCLKMYEWLASEKLDESILGGYSFDQKAWENDIKRIYKSAAPEVIELEEHVHKNSNEKREHRMEQLLTHIDEVHELIRSLPSAERAAKLLADLGAPVYPSQIDVTDAQVVDGCIYAKELRDRTGLLQILHDLGLEKTYGQRLVKEFCGSTRDVD